VSTTDLAALAAELKAKGVRALTVAWADANGIQRSRSAPIDKLASAVERGLGCSVLFAVFDSHDHIRWGVEGLETASGDFRIKAVPERIVQLAGQPAFAWAPAQLWTQDGPRWEHCYRAALERTVERASALGYEFKAGCELEWFIGEDSDEPVAAHNGPVYSPNAMLDVSEFLSELLGDLDANGLTIGQIHAEYGWSQLEISLDATDPLAAADNQLLARETIRAAARANDLRASFAPLITPDGVGNGWHFHLSVVKGGTNLLSGGSGPEGMTEEGEAFVAGILRDLQGVVAVTAPSVPSLIRLRPGYFASAYGFWGTDNREASLRFVPGSTAIGTQNANIELKASDASGNPYLGLTAMIAAGLAGIEDGLKLPEQITEDPGGWTPEQREARGIKRFAQTTDEQIANFEAAPRIREAFGDPLANAFVGVRRADADWADGKSAEEIIAAHLWRY
jgi:glutamine synthetase